MSSGLWPSRDPVREYGRGVGTALDVRPDVEAFRFGFPGVVAVRVPLVLLASGLRAGVGCRLGVCLRSGDSGRGRDGLLGLNCGLCGLAPGPSDCENLGAAPPFMPVL